MNIDSFNKKYSKQLTEEHIKYMPENLKDLARKAIECENNGEFIKAKQLCENILEKDSSVKTDPAKIVLARVYPALIKQYAVDETEGIRELFEEYIRFLDSVTMNELMQEYLVETLFRLCELLDNERFRPVFSKFVDIIDDKGYLTDEEYERTIESAYIAIESSQYYDDLKLSTIVKNFVKSVYKVEFTSKEKEDEQSVKPMILDSLVNYWYICEYYKENEGEFVYLKTAFPYSYALVADKIEKVIDDKEKTQDSIIDSLLEFVTKGTTKQQLETSMKAAYENVLKNKDRDFVVYEGNGEYKRSSSKVGRNDMCPCGSGRKYKQCCGKNV